MASRVAIIDSGGANIRSVMFAFERLGIEPCFTHDRHEISAASHVVLPGVGAAASAMKRLQDAGLVDVITQLTQPVLGICLGMQLLFERSEEGNTTCLGIIPASVEKMPESKDYSLPHTGWNRVHWSPAGSTSPLAASVESGAFAYFVHGYAAPAGPWTMATTRHGVEFSSIVRWQNFVGIQFHPERSAATGQRLIAAFLASGRNAENGGA